MTKVMPENKMQEKLRWITPIIQGESSIEEVVKWCPFSRRTLYNWLKNYQEYGEIGLLGKSTRPHTSPNKISQYLEDKIVELHLNNLVGAQKINWMLEKQDIKVSTKTIQRILNRYGLVKPKRPTNKQKCKTKIITIPGELVEIDIKYGINFGFNRWWYQYTAIDVASRWRFLVGYPNMQNDFTLDFVSRLQTATGQLFDIQAIKTDNGAVFTNRLSGLRQDYTYRPHCLDIWCKQNNIHHYLISPGCPTQNGHIERSHRTDQECFYDFLERKPKSIDEYNYLLTLWSQCYNQLPHCGLKGLSPNEYLEKFR